MKNHLFVFIFFSILLSCQEKKYEYYPSGEIKKEFQIVNGRLNGVLLEFYENGRLKIKQHWKNGLLDGSIEEFYPSGKLLKKGYLRADKFVELNSYSESGNILSIHHFDSDGNVLDIQRYNENGTRDSSAFPFCYFKPYGDTIETGEEAMFNVRIVNAIDPIYKNGQLIIASGFDTLKYQVKPKDTLEVIDPQDSFGYTYRFTPIQKGRNVIYGQFIFKQYFKDEIVAEVMRFYYPYYVRDAPSRSSSKSIANVERMGP